MKPFIGQPRRWTALVGTAILLAGAGSVILGGDPALKIEGIAVKGNVVQISVLNPGPGTLSATLFVRVLIENREVGALSPMTVPGGQRSSAEIPMPAPVEGVIAVGVILDDGSPF